MIESMTCHLGASLFIASKTRIRNQKDRLQYKFINTSTAALGAFAHCLQARTVCNGYQVFQNGQQGYLHSY